MMATAVKTDYEELSIRAIAKRCNLDRATTKKRLDDHQYLPLHSEAKLVTYAFDALMEARLTEVNDKLGEVRVRKERAMAELKEIEVQEARGELVSTSEVMDMTQRTFGAMHKEIAVRMPQRLAARLAKAKTALEVKKLLTHDLNGIFKTLRDDHARFLGNGKK